MRNMHLLQVSMPPSSYPLFLYSVYRLYRSTTLVPILTLLPISLFMRLFTYPRPKPTFSLFIFNVVTKYAIFRNIIFCRLTHSYSQPMHTELFTRSILPHRIKISVWLRLYNKRKRLEPESRILEAILKN